MSNAQSTIFAEITNDVVVAYTSMNHVQPFDGIPLAFVLTGGEKSA